MTIPKQEREQAEGHEGQEQKEQQPTPPPETPEETDNRRLEELKGSIPKLKDSTERTGQELKNAVNQLNAEPPRVEISRGTVTKETLEDQENEQSEIQGRHNIAKTNETPVKTEASREQMQKYLEDKIKTTLREVPTELNVVRTTTEGEVTPDQIAKLPAMQEVKGIFHGSEEITPEEIDEELAKMSKQLAVALKEKGGNVDIRADEIETMGLEAFADKIKAAAAENPQTKEKSSHAKTQEEKEAKKKSVSQQPIPGRHTQKTEEEGLRP